MPGNDTNTKLLIHSNYGLAAGEYAHYKLNDNAANTTVTDSGSGANNGTASANTSGLTTTGKINAAFDFNGSSNYVNIDTFRTAVAADTKGTIAMWLRADTQSGGTSFSVSATSGTGTLFYVTDNGANKFYVQYYNNGTADWEWSSAANAYPLSTWVHFVIVQDGVSPKFYVNGVLDTTALTVSTNPSRWMSSLVNDNAATLGAYRYAGSTSGYFDGKIDDFRYYQNIALGQEAITAIYNAGTGTENSLIVDASASAHPITAYGNTYIVPAVPDQTSAKLASGGGNALFNGTSAYLSVPDSDDWYFGTGDFTIDGWFYFTSLTSQPMLFAQYADSNNFMYCEVLSDGKIFWGATIGSVSKGQYRSSSAGVITTGSWIHIALVRNGTSFYIFKNGVSVALDTETAISTNDLGNVATTLLIGRGNASFYLNGYIDELRISKGIARYTANFTPSTRFTADSYTKLLLHFDSNVTTDSETTPKTVTNNNVVWNAGSKWNSGALSFDGTGDYLSIPDSADWDINADSSNWTVDSQVLFAVSNLGEFILGQSQNDNNEWYIAKFTDNKITSYFWNGGVNEFGGGSNQVSGISTLSSGVFYHIAFIKTGYFYGIYINGVQDWFSWTNATATRAAEFLVGKIRTFYHEGNIDELRVQKSNYFLAAPNSFPAAPLLLIGEGVDEATTMPNNGYSGAVTMSGGAKLDNGAKKFNATTSMFFDGANDYLTVSETTAGDYNVVGSLTDSWTIDLWVKHDTPNDAGTIEWYAGLNLSTSPQWDLYHAANTALTFRAYNASSVLILNSALVGGDITDTNWHHVAVVKSGSNFGIYLDGTQYGYSILNSTASISGTLSIGYHPISGGYFDGNMEQVQITKGNKFGVVPDAGLTSTFSVPTAVLTQNTITQPTEEYGPPDLTVIMGAPLSLGLALNPPVEVLKYDNPSSLALVLTLNAPQAGPTVFPATLTLTATLNSTTEAVTVLPATLTLTLTQPNSTPVVLHQATTLQLTGTTYGPAFGIYSTPATLAGLLTINAPTPVITGVLSTIILSATVNNGIPTPTATPTTLAGMMAILSPTPEASEEGAIVNLNLTILTPIPTVTQHKGSVPGGELELTISAGFAPTIGSIAPTIVRYIKDPVVTGGCPQCGSFVYTKRSRKVDGVAIRHGRNFDRNGALNEDGYVRCGRCGFIVHPKRNPSHPDGSHTGWGMRYEETEAGS